MDREAIADLAKEAAHLDERRVLVLAGETGHFDAAAMALETAASTPDAGVSMSDTTVVGPPSGIACEHLEPEESGALLGTTRSAIVLDCREACEPNVLGRLVGAVDGGGLFVLLTPPLDRWAGRRDGFDKSLAVPPDPIDAVTGLFRDRLVETLWSHPGIGIVDLASDELVRNGITGRPPALESATIEQPPGAHSIPEPILEACLTQDQVDAVGQLAAFQDGPRAAVLEAGRGRGKSSVAGLLAAWFAAQGKRIVVTGPKRRAATAFFDRILEVLPTVDAIQSIQGSPPRRIDAESDGTIEYVPATEVDSAVESADVVFVEEAAALSVTLLESTLDANRVVYTTTVHGYEGSGRGFAVRFRDSLGAARHDVQDISLVEPIRYAGGDPVEVWAARALLLNAGPIPGSVIEDATPESVSYADLAGGTLRHDEQLLREVFGLLVSAHYRTEPNDLARLLDGSNLAVRALFQDGHVVAVALLAREGGIPASLRERVYEGHRIRGNMLPDVLMSQLRDEDAGGPVGLRIVRIATHHAVRSRGLGSFLLDRIEREFESVVDWLGTGFGVTPELVSLWHQSGYSTVHLSTSRNDRSGEHSVLMLNPTSERGRILAKRHGTWFGTRIGGILADSLVAVDPSVIRATLEAVDYAPALSITPHQWRVIASAAFGPGLYSVDPAPFRNLALHALIDGSADLSDREKRLLIRGLLQHQSWDHVAEVMGYESRTAAMRALGRALQPLVAEYGTPAAKTVRRRFTEPEDSKSG
jgi:tRNA(Met) cytidine acetyltransferase